MQYEFGQVACTHERPDPAGFLYSCPAGVSVGGAREITDNQRATL
jgi:hypothetical protein